jgi:hypothetical protein
MKLRVIIPLALLVLLMAYTAAFWHWWQQSRRYTRLAGGKPVEYVEFHYNWFSWHTRPLWVPALWTAERIGGYHELGFAAGYEESAILYAR